MWLKSDWDKVIHFRRRSKTLSFGPAHRYVPSSGHQSSAGTADWSLLPQKRPHQRQICGLLALRIQGAGALRRPP